MNENVIFSRRKGLSQVLSGTLMIAGTAIGAGMLGIPLLTAESGFWPSFFITTFVWIFMLCTGFLFLEASLWMPEGANIMSMAQRFLGSKWKFAAGGMFIFLYYCLMVAYFAAGAPLLASFINTTFGLKVAGAASYALFGTLFGLIVALGSKAIDRVNIVLTIVMVIDYFIMVWIGSSEVQLSNLAFTKWSAVAVSLPVLFSAFGYHNVIPALCNYLKRERKSLQLSIVLGTSLPFLFYVIWQWLIIGTASPSALAEARAEGLTATSALPAHSSIFLFGQCFAFFAVVTSMLGVAFSLVDFLGDGAKLSGKSVKRSTLVVATFLPPFLCVLFDPTLFDRALGIAGGFGEAFLNGFLPVMLVWMGRYAVKLPSDCALPGGRLTLTLLLIVSVFVIGLELFLVLVK